MIECSEKVTKLFDKVTPYIDFDAFPAKLKEGAPDDIRECYDELLILEKKERESLQEL